MSGFYLNFPGHPHAALQPRSARFGLLPLRSPLLGESLLISVPELLRWFTSLSLASVSYFIQISGWRAHTRRITPFGHPRVNGYVLLSAAFRSLSRPSSPSSSIGIRHEPIFRLTILSFLFPRISSTLLPPPDFILLMPSAPSALTRHARFRILPSLAPFRLPPSRNSCFFPSLSSVKELPAILFQAIAFMEQDRVELSTPALSERCSNQLSYCSKSQSKYI